MANSYLTRTPSSAGNRKTFTISCWVKRSKLSYNYDMFYTAGTYNSTQMSQLYFANDDLLRFGSWDSNGAANHYLETYRKFRDTNAWYHIVVAVDTTQATASNRVKIYINGVQETLNSSNNYPAQNHDYAFNSTLVHNIGRREDLASSYHEGYLSHVVMVDGQALAQTVFGETDSTSGIWKFKSPSGVTWGTNGFHLKFENSGALGTDSSGNSNTFTVNGNLKQALDTPSNVYATLDNLHKGTHLGDATFSNGNLKHQGTLSGGNYPYTFSTLAVSQGKWYAEFKVGSDPSTTMIGIASGIADSFLGGTASAKGYALYGNGNLFTSGSGSSYGSSLSVGDILGVAMDLDNNKLYFSKNGTFHNSGDPTSGATGTGAVSITAPADNGTGVYHFACGKAGSATTSIEANFGNGFFGTTAITSAGSNGNGSLFEYDVPNGYYALNTKNINTYWIGYNYGIYIN